MCLPTLKGISVIYTWAVKKVEIRQYDKYL